MTNAPESITVPDVAAAAHIEDALDEALDESFPASDPVAIRTGTSPTTKPNWPTTPELNLSANP